MIPTYPEGESALLSLMATVSAQIDIARDTLPLEAFFVPNHRILYQIMLNRREKGLACDVMALWQALRDVNQIEAFGSNGVEVHTILGVYNHISTWDFLVSQVMSRFHARNVITAAKELSEAAVCEPETLHEVVERLLPTLQSQSAKSGMKPIKEVLFEALERWDNRRTRGISFGFKALDEATGGAFPGEVTIVCGQAKSGKTSLAMQMGCTMANQGQGAAIFSLEMSDAELVDRMVSNHGVISLSKFRTQKYSADDFSRMHRAVGEMSSLPIWISQGAATISAIYSEARRLKARHGIFLVLVDYIQLVESAKGKGESREQQVAGISRALKRLAMELGVHVIALSQLNEDGKLRESRAIGQDANLVLMVDAGKEPTDRVLRIALQRNGPAGAEIPITFRGDFVKFEG